MENIISRTNGPDIAVETDEGVEQQANAITPNTVIVCGTCGAKMETGPLNRNTKEVSYDGNSRKFSIGDWLFNCRVCRSGTVKVSLNPMLDNDNLDAILPAREQLVDDMMHDRLTYSTNVGSGHVIVEGDGLVEAEVDGDMVQFHEGRKNLDAIDE